jgi:hypothetical protein
MTWRTVKAFDTERAKLRASELLDQSSVLAVGTGAADESARNQWLDEMRDAAGFERPVRRAVDRDEHLANLAAIGIHAHTFAVDEATIARRLAERDRVLAERAAAAEAGG